MPARSHKPYDVGSNPTSATDFLRAGQCPVGVHDPGGQVRLLGPRLERIGNRVVALPLELTNLTRPEGAALTERGQAPKA